MGRMTSSVPITAEIRPHCTRKEAMWTPRARLWISILSRWTAETAPSSRNTAKPSTTTKWSDVLNAKVTSSYEGHYGVQIGLTGDPAERLRDFSFMLAGHCPVEGYDRWVNSGEQEQAQTEPKQFM